MVRKRTKIYDCFFYLDELEILKLRLNLLNEFVDEFIIIESEQNFAFEKKNSFLDTDSLLEGFPLEKITILKIPFLDEESVRVKYKEKRATKMLIELNNFGLSKKDILNYSMLELSDFLLKKDFLLDDLIILSDVDEIPELNCLDEIIDSLVYGPLFFRNKNFIWSDNFCTLTTHEGSIIFNFSQIISNKRIFQDSYFSKNIFRGRKNNMKRGWHLSHFYDLDRTLEKFTLLYPEKNLSKKDIIDNFINLRYPIKNVFDVNENLVENSEPLLFSTISLPKPYLGRNKRKKVLVTLNEDFEYDKTKFDFDVKIKIDQKFLPKRELYEDSENFFLLNEVPFLLKNHFLLNQDVICVVFDSNVSILELEREPNYFDEQQRFAILDWKTMKNNTLSDLIFPETT